MSCSFVARNRQSKIQEQLLEHVHGFVHVHTRVHATINVHTCTHSPTSVTGTVFSIGSEKCELRVRQNWGLRVVVRTGAGKEKVLWGRELHRCSKNPHTPTQPYNAKEYHTWNRKSLRKLKEGSTVQYLVHGKWQPTRALRIVRGGSFQNAKYSVPVWRCLHEHSVRLTKKMIERARRDNRLWGAGLRAPRPMIRERVIVRPETYKHLREWIFSPEFVEQLKASEQATQRGHCFGVREAVTTTFKRYKKQAEEKGLEHVSERVYRCVHSHYNFLFSIHHHHARM